MKRSFHSFSVGGAESQGLLVCLFCVVFVFSSVKPQCSPSEPDAAVGVAAIRGVWEGWENLPASLLFCSSCDWTLGLVREYIYPLFRGQGDAVVLVVRFANNVFYNPTPRAKGVKPWEVKVRWPGSVALFLCLNC